ncbi:aryl-alcohol dehydrogenase-like predicted oxidoreductase [Panacagrimonas perspica]|uniref:Protein tas n=1 Tax=Panacagrimonas perspica TaxID=381431 RepID=A0A4R7NZL8_9GAMM|nr:NADP(H)-dependent aldo-keto reductase [Panacagrimonas perspica]TDU26697.1 aryl-alcohol dehydrogenase-like predicted oxidoreductase [Panacagrimonas perspica]THD04044.1 NADP(H)-dependent aldo-keto reductase [Panacagrimonas perspica]
MEYRKLSHTELNVSLICLGTMTWGEQNTEVQAHEQMDYALAQGINFFDVAEMYPVPPKPDTQGRTEQYIGTWFKKTGKRKDIVLATKVTGPGFAYLRGGSKLDRKSVLSACDDNLKRLQTDYIDLYQVHWPQRPTNYFGKLGYEHTNTPAVPIEETLGALDELVKQGKVRHVGVSNETPWGLHQYLSASREKKLTRIASIQNPYSLLNRSFEIGLAEFAHRENIALLAYSPMAFGVLSGKYLDGKRPADGRVTLFARFSRYSNPQADGAAAEYVALAKKNSLDPAQMALAFVNSRPFLTSTIIGATTMEQLRSNIASEKIRLSADVLAEIEKIHQRFTIPCP